MPKYKHLSIPPKDFVAIEQLTKLFNSRNKTDLKPPKIVIMAVLRVLAEMEADDDVK